MWKEDTLSNVYIVKKISELIVVENRENGRPKK